MEEQKGLVSIILNCFNGAKYLRDALDTVIKQNYNNWELVFWDNQSTDNSKIIFDSYKSEKFRYFYSKNHTTLYEARNQAIKESKGEFIAFIDSDDTWEADKLERQIKLFEKKEVGLVYGNLWIYNKRLNKKKIFSKNTLLKGKIYNSIFSDYKIGIIATTLRKKILIENKIVFEKKYNHIGDFDLFVKLSKICEFDAVQDPVATYRIHGENLSLKNSKNEILEMKFWYQNNRFNLSKDQENHFLTKIADKEFYYLKFNRDFFETFKFFLKERNLKQNIKNYILLFSPVFILKKFIWYQ